MYDIHVNVQHIVKLNKELAKNMKTICFIESYANLSNIIQ